MDYAREKKIGLDFNPTYFSHPMADSGMILASADDSIRNYWIQHGIACRKIGDGSKDYRVDKAGPRLRLIDSLNQIFAEKIDRKYNIDSLESKLFGLGAERTTSASA